MRTEGVLTQTPLAREMWEEVLEDVISLIDLVIRRSWAGKVADPELKRSVRDALEAAKQELAHVEGAGLEDRRGRNGGQAARDC